MKPVGRWRVLARRRGRSRENLNKKDKEKLEVAAKDMVEKGEIERVPIWEQLSLSGDLSVTYAKEGMTCSPIKLSFAPGGILEQRGYAVPDYAMKGKNVPVGGKLCVVIHQEPPAETMLTHGSLVSSFAEIAKSWVELGAESQENQGVDIVENPSVAVGRPPRTFKVVKGEGQFGQLWLERVK
jgi:hypothetical protein